MAYDRLPRQRQQWHWVVTAVATEVVMVTAATVATVAAATKR